MLSAIKRLVPIGLAILISARAFASRQVTDELGRHVVLPDRPNRIICLAPSLTETVFALGLGDSVAGITDYTDYPPEARAKPSVGGLVDPSMEKMISLHPDLVIATRELNRRETVEQIERFGVPVFVVNPQGLDGILASIQHIGQAVGRSKEAQALVSQLEEKRRQVAARVKGLRRPSVFILIWYEPVMTAGHKAFITDVVSAAGGDSVTADIPQAWPQISMEEVLRRSPDYVLLFRKHDGGIAPEELKSREGWSRLEAVRRNRLILMDERLEHSSPVVFDALADLAKRLHPEAFASR